MTGRGRLGALTGAAFLMATSAIGPGFLTQTAVFTQQLAASFGFVILASVVIDIGAQLNVWRVIAVADARAQDIANRVLPGSGWLLAVLVVLGGAAFNIGNIAGTALSAWKYCSAFRPGSVPCSVPRWRSPSFSRAKPDARWTDSRARSASG